MPLVSHQIGDCTLIHGDARDLEPAAHDMVMCDAPYPLESGGNSTGEMGGKFAVDTYDNSGHIVECDITWPEVWRVFADGIGGTSQAHIYCMSNNRNIYDCWDAALKAGFQFHNILPWKKQTVTPNRWYMKNCEFTLLFKKGAAFPINDCGQTQLISCGLKAETKHPTEKPVELMANYIRQSTQPGQTVFDPFMGGGTTLVAAVREGRKAVGVEIDPEHFETACKRVEQTYAQFQLELIA